MLLQRLIIRVRRIGDETRDLQILDANQLRLLLVRERARTDRTGRAFSLLTFTATEPPSRGKPFRKLLKILKGRLRITDVIGLMTEERLAVVLPETDARGAWKVADDILAAFPSGAVLPQCEVFTYPAEWPPLPDEETADWTPRDDRVVQPMEMLFVRPLPLWKRGLDIVGASIGLMVAAPVLGVSAALIKIASPGPVLFTQWRSGAGSHPFLMYKLRTMSVDAESRKQELMALNEQDGPAFKIKSDPRVTRVGRILRKTSIDELPQLWNVLKGDMSLVGPRPLPCDESANCARWQKNRLDAKPGLTCIWQVRGRSKVSFDEWVRMDLEYLRSISLWVDLKLIAQTVYVVLLRRGAF